MYTVIITSIKGGSGKSYSEGRICSLNQATTVGSAVIGAGSPRERDNLQIESDT